MPGVSVALPRPTPFFSVVACASARVPAPRAMARIAKAKRGRRTRMCVYSVERRDDQGSLREAALSIARRRGPWCIFHVDQFRPGAMMFSHKSVVFSLAAALAIPASRGSAQVTPERAVRRDIPITNTFRRALAAGSRDSTGRPTAKYWQLRTDYTINARLDP